MSPQARTVPVAAAVLGLGVLALLGAVLGRGRLELPWLGVAAVVGLAGLVLWLAPRLAAAPAAAPPPGREPVDRS